MKVVATSRKEQGSSASRRLRRAGQVPGIVYGGNVEPTAVAIEHNPLYHSLRVEAFHSSILDMELDGKTEQVLLRDVQWHPYKPVVMHIDFQRVAAGEKITVKVPLHFVNQEISPAVKLSAAIVGHVVNEIEITCLPKDLPSFIEVDLSNLETTQTVHANDIKLPAGVSLAQHGGENPAIVTVTVPAGAKGEEGEEAK
ncbi:MAG: 50S ribosomal protein L25/general stress protein Ctc [Lautropia sp. SCN 70-15]|nr:MAG: 50S ribosomal protein L25/general stress protein Ctc [Lautropia sp. SCN 70-15]